MSMMGAPPSAGATDQDREAGDDVALPWRAWIVTLLVLLAIGLGWFHAVAPREEADDRREALRDLRRCGPATDDLIAAVLAERASEDDGRFVSWVTRESKSVDGVWFVSAEHRDPDLADRADGEIATWAVRSLDDPGADVVAVEPIAAEHTTWPRSDDPIDVRDTGSLESRRCVAQLREEDVRQRWP